MSGRWNIASIDGKYKIQKNDNTGTPIDYFTINSDGNIGINNSSPLNKLHINGDSFIDGNILTSNILGIVSESINYLKINNTENYNNNIFEIYGKTLLKGNLGIGNTNPQYKIDVSGTIKGTAFIGDGSNITNIHTSNITNGILKPERGGTGIGDVKISQILFGSSNNTITQNNNLLYNQNSGLLRATSFSGDGVLITNINASEITRGVLHPTKGGTGLDKYIINGGVLIGNIDGNNLQTISQSDILKWDININNNINSNILNIGGDIKLKIGSKILIGDNKLAYSDIGSYKTATRDSFGVLRLSTDFTIDSSSNISLTNGGTSSKWGLDPGNNGSIFFPSISSTTNKSVSIGGIEDLANSYRLNVYGDINTSNGVFKINGNNVIQNNSNIISDRINNFNLDSIIPPFYDNNGLEHINGGVLSKCFTFIDQDSSYTITSEPKSSSFTFKDKVTFLKGIRIDGDLDITGTNNAYTILNAIEIVSNIITAALKCNQQGSGDIFVFEKTGNVECILSDIGYLGIGRDISRSFNDTIIDQLGVITKIKPIERLHVVGNIIATGNITSYYSDERLKTFTSNITNSLEIIDSLSGYRYIPNELAIENGFKCENEIGLSAQQVQKVLPEIVKIAPFDSIKDENGKIISKSGNNYLTICYDRLGAVFVEAIKELNADMKKLKEENISLKEDIKNIKKVLNI